MASLSLRLPEHLLQDFQDYCFNNKLVQSDIIRDYITTLLEPIPYFEVEQSNIIFTSFQYKASGIPLNDNLIFNLLQIISHFPDSIIDNITNIMKNNISDFESLTDMLVIFDIIEKLHLSQDYKFNENLFGILSKIVTELESDSIYLPLSSRLITLQHVSEASGIKKKSMVYNLIQCFKNEITGQYYLTKQKYFISCKLIKELFRICRNNSSILSFVQYAQPNSYLIWKLASFMLRDISAFTIEELDKINRKLFKNGTQIETMLLQNKLSPQCQYLCNFIILMALNDQLTYEQTDKLQNGVLKIYQEGSKHVTYNPYKLLDLFIDVIQMYHLPTNIIVDIVN